MRLVVHKSEKKILRGEKEDELQTSLVFKLDTKKRLQSFLSYSLAVTQVPQILRVCVLIDMELRVVLVIWKSSRSYGGWFLSSIDKMPIIERFDQG